ncbi:MAG: hypothetical protein CVU50_05090 [Candidatus Cloacimonetes bacterium HGW-Cloacimonetes-3]|jgi:hypothetical protein|nr:MAG: hypothetical protein CVU50_05090 [Candidatus Cloacimonetes bacterium HGW-Cloacimonetes-3]
MKKMYLLMVIIILTSGGMFATALNESFSKSAFPPAGWKVINGGDTNTWTRYTGALAHSSSCAMIYYSTGTHDDWLITPQLSPTTGDATFSFWAFNNYIQLDRCNVKLSTSSNNQADFTVSLATNLAPPNGWTLYTYSLSAYAGQTVYIAIQAISTNIGNLLIDDVTGPSKTGFDGFETNNFTSYNWGNSSASPWTIQSTELVSGSYAAKSGAISNNSSTSITLTQAGLLAGYVSFYQKVSSEAFCDYLRFYIDDVQQGEWSGAGSWALQSYPVTAGTHTFRWTYSKDFITVSGSDCAWIDEVYLPPIIYGAETNPYLIYDFNQLNSVRNFVGATYTGKYFKLMSDIDATPTLTTNWVPIGNNTSMFYGNFDGNNHTISNLRSWYYDVYHGLFGMTAVGSTVKNLNLASTCSILGNGDSGSVVGHNKGLVQNCTSAATVNIGNAEVGGGLVGNNLGTISNCSFSGTITRSGSGVTCNKIGGIAGNNDTGASILESFSTGSVSGNAWCGGLVGWNNGTISRCYSTGTMIGAANSIGGLVGQHQGTITNSYSRATVTGASYVGGLVGYNSASTITNCYSTGTVTGSIKGGLCGQTGATITSSYWDTQTSGIATSFGGTGKTTAEMKTQSTYIGWDYTRETANGTNDYWTIWSTDNNGYPELYWKHATELRVPALTYPADAASALPISGFNLTWIPNSAGQAPVSYTLYMVLGDVDHLYDPAFPGQHTFAGITGTSFNPVTTGGLTFHYGEQWYWEVVAYNATGTASPPSGYRYFITERDPFATESFEVGNVNDNTNIFEWTQPPSGYQLTQWRANNSQTTYNRSPRTGNWNLTMYFNAMSYTFGWLFRPYPLVGGVTYDVEVYARQATNNDGWALLGLYFGTSAAEAAMTNELTPSYMVHITDGDYQRVAGTFTPATTGTYYLGIRNRMSDNIFYMSLDDVTVRAAAVPNPVSLVSPANLAAGQAVLPTLSWSPTATGGLVTGYKVYCQASATPITPTTLLATVPAGTYSYTLTTPLSTDATYYWMVVATNALGNAVGSPVRSFSTITTTILYETFDTYPPVNWTAYSGELANPSTLSPSWGWNQKLWGNTYTTPANNAACKNIWSSFQSWLVSPPLQLGGAPYQLQLDIALTDWNNSNPITSDPNGTTGIDDRFVILIGDGSTWTPANILREWNNTGSPYVYNDIPNTGLHVTIPLDAYSGVKYIAFYGASLESNADNDFFVDNVHVYIPPINDLAVTSIFGTTAGIAGTPVTHTVTVANYGTGEQTSYTVYLKSVSPAFTIATLNVTTPLAAGASAIHNITWTPTTTGVDMEIYAEVVLATDTTPTNNSSASMWFFPHVAGVLLESFESGIPANWSVLNPDGSYCWEQFLSFAHSGSFSALAIAYLGAQSDDWLITPPLQLSTDTTDMISFWMKSYDESYPETWEVLISTTNTQPASFTLIDSGTLVSSDYTRMEYNLDAYGNAVIYFAVRYRSQDYAALAVDDFHGPLIYIPTALDAPSVTITPSGNFVFLNWNAIVGATEYHVYASDDPYSWPLDFTVVPASEIRYGFNADSAAGKFFKVTAYYGRSNTKPIATPPAKIDNSRLEALKAGLKDKRK